MVLDIELKEWEHSLLVSFVLPLWALLYLITYQYRVIQDYLDVRPSNMTAIEVVKAKYFKFSKNIKEA